MVWEQHFLPKQQRFVILSNSAEQADLSFPVSRFLYDVSACSVSSTSTLPRVHEVLDHIWSTRLGICSPKHHALLLDPGQSVSTRVCRPQPEHLQQPLTLNTYPRSVIISQCSHVCLVLRWPRRAWIAIPTISHNHVPLSLQHLTSRGGCWSCTHVLSCVENCSLTQ